MVVKIGHVAPTSGAIAHLGKDNENGARLAIDELNAKGVTIGGRKVKLELLAEDDAADPKQGTAAAQKLVDSKVNGVVGHLNSGTSIPASKIYSDAGIPQISPSATNSKFTRQGYKTTFRVIADDAQLGSALGEYAVKKLNGKNIAVIDDRTDYGQGVAAEFEKGAKAAGGNIVGREFTNNKATDFTTILSSIRGKRPDVVFFGGMDSVAGPMLQQMQRMGMTAKFLGGDGICSSELSKLAAGTIAPDRVICAEAGGSDGATRKSMDEFATKFRRKFNSDVQIYAPYVYDAVMVMVNAMVKAGSADPAKYLPILAKTEGYKGVTGIITFDNKGDIKNGAVTLYTYGRDAKRKQIEVIGAPLTRLPTTFGGWTPTEQGERERPKPEQPKPPRDPFEIPSKDLGSHRAMGDAAGSPAVVAALTGEPLPTSSQAALQLMSSKSRWGTAEEAEACIVALQRLSASGRADNYSATRDEEARTVEKAFASACLGQTDPRIASRVGVLRNDRGVLCTVTLLAADLALTARHCVLTNPALDSTESRASVGANPATLNALSVEFGPLTSPTRSSVREIVVRDAEGSRRVATDLAERQVLTLSGIDQIQGDFALLVLTSSIPNLTLTPFRVAKPERNDKIFMASYYPGYRLSSIANETGLRQQKAGYCQVVEVQDRCFAHGCATNGAASGAAIFVERAGTDGRSEIRLVGVHSSGASSDPYTRCSTNNRFANYFNIGVRVRDGEITVR